MYILYIYMRPRIMCLKAMKLASWTTCFSRPANCLDSIVAPELND